jgi:hypothetical protein
VLGYRRFEGLEATAALARLYATARLFVNFFQPSSERPGVHPDGQLRTFQRRVKAWRREIAQKMVFGTPGPEQVGSDAATRLSL